MQLEKCTGSRTHGKQIESNGSTIQVEGQGNAVDLSYTRKTTKEQTSIASIMLFHDLRG